MDTKLKRIINPWLGVKEYNCFGCCPNNQLGVKMDFFEDGDEIVSYWHPQADYQGWVDTLHGGIQAVLLDEISAWVVSRKLQTTGVTSRLDMHYKKPVSTNEKQLTLRASLKETKRNVAFIEARLYNGAGELCSYADAVYFCASKEKAKSEMKFEGCDVEE